jgi:flagellar P-ring protein precursor FlgI
MKATRKQAKACQARRLATLGWMAAFCLLAGSALAVRVKDVTHVEGVRDNMLVGYGLVVGLNGTGDTKSSSPFTMQSLSAYLKNNGMTVAATSIDAKNVAAVIVTATLPPFASLGTRMDVEVNAVGDSKSLQGGTLIMTPLKGADEQVYAVAQGPVATGGFDAGGGGTSVSKNHPTVGKIPGGALIERQAPTHFQDRAKLTLTLDNPDFTTAERVAQVINKSYRPDLAKALSSAAVEVAIPAKYLQEPTVFMAEIERLPVHPDQRARIVIDEKTGTVVMGEDVRIATLAIAHGNLSIQISQTKQVSQPGPLSGGTTADVSNTQVAVQEESRSLAMVSEGVSLGEVVQSLNAVGVTPRDLISILQAIKACGALQAELVIQ